jgi:hypothetical protein
MIGPVSGTGRAMMSSLQQAIQKGMPPEQAVQYVKSMAMEGVAPLADLYAMMNQFQRLKQQKVTPPQTPPTIKDQLNALDQQSQMPQQGGIAQLQAPAPAGQPMDRGLGAIDAGLMEYPKFANGGIVAFDDGGTADSEPGFFSRLASGFASMGGSPYAAESFVTGPERRLGDLGQALANVPDEELANQLANAVMSGDQKAATDLSVVLRQRNRKDIVDRVTSAAKTTAKTQAAETRAAELGFGKPPPAAPVAAPPAPVTERRPAIMGGGAASAPPAREDITDEQYEKLQAFRKREGLGAAREEMRQFLTSEEKRLDKAYGEDKRLAFADIGFKMAAAASRPGATFLGALAEGAMSGTQAMRAMNKELAENKRLLKQSMIKLKEADELEKEGDYKAAMGLNREARAEALKLYELRENMKLDREKIAAQREATAVTREYTQQSRQDTLDFNKRKEVLETLGDDMSYQTLRNRLTALSKDPEENAAEINSVRSQMADIKRQAEIDVGLTLGDTQSAAQGQGFGRRYRFDIASGKMIPVE